MRKENYERRCREAVEFVGRFIGEWLEQGIKATSETKAEPEKESEVSGNV
jgi:hypothetical protein